MSSSFAPILLFTYKRLDTLKQTVSALQANQLAAESDLFIFSDAGKTEQDQMVVENIRKFLKTITGFRKIEIYEAEKNKGLASSIISGVSKVIEQYGRVIVLEDDLETTPNFLLFMNTCLDKYQKNDAVFSISGYSFNLGEEKRESLDAYFLNRGWSWGWATWQDRWTSVDWQVSDYATFVKNAKARKMFAKGGSDLNKMLDTQMAGKLDSWAIRWFYHQFRINGLTIYPVFSKVYNDGFDANATHTTGSSSRYQPSLDRTHKTQFNLPDSIEVSPYYQSQFQKKMGIWSRIVSKVETIYQKIIK